MRKGWPVRRRIDPLPLAFAAYLVFCLCLIVNYQVASDGTWYLYAKSLANGTRLYSDLRLPQQPLFILLTVWWQTALGGSWLLSLIPTIVNLLLFASGFYLLARRSDWPARERALMFLCGALLAIGWNSYRFDDYRVLTDTISVYLVLLFLHLFDDAAGRISWKSAMLIGALCGLSFMTRANDGLLLLCSAVPIALSLASGNRMRAGAQIMAGFLIVASLIWFLTGDTLRAYLDYTLLQSAASKGGTHQVLLSPVLLIGNLFHFLFRPIPLLLILILALASAMPLLVAHWLKSRQNGSSHALAAAVILLLFVFESVVIINFHEHAYDFITNLLSPLGMIGLFATTFSACLAIVGVIAAKNAKSAVLLIPCGAVVAAGMSSGGEINGIHGPIGLFLALLPIVFTRDRLADWVRVYVVSVASLLAAAIIVGKISHPLQWQFYKAQPLFVDRSVIRHPLYGPMVVDRKLNRFFIEVCAAIKANKSPAELLSMPYSYANYYCGIEPWHHNVQTYFDTSSAETIERIAHDLTRRPPAWILYQRQLKILRSNEVFFNHGAPSPHRKLDDLIRRRIGDGTWKIVTRSVDQPGDEWFLIRTAAVTVAR